jgi:hypothetical protein
LRSADPEAGRVLLHGLHRPWLEGQPVSAAPHGRKVAQFEPQVRYLADLVLDGASWAQELLAIAC